MHNARNRIYVGILALLVAAVVISGCGGGVIDGLLQIADVSALLPDKWTSAGGLVTVVADVVGGVEKVVALVKRLDGSNSTPVTLTPNANGQYQGTFQAGANTSAAGSVTYSVTVTATDSSGNTASSTPVQVNVPPVGTTATSR